MYANSGIGQLLNYRPLVSWSINRTDMNEWSLYHRWAGFHSYGHLLFPPVVSMLSRTFCFPVISLSHFFKWPVNVSSPLINQPGSCIMQSLSWNYWHDWMLLCSTVLHAGTSWNNSLSTSHPKNSVKKNIQVAKPSTPKLPGHLEPVLFRLSLWCSL